MAEKYNAVPSFHRIPWFSLTIIYLLSEVLLSVLVADIQPTNTGMLDSEVDLIILLGRGVM